MANTGYKFPGFQAPKQALDYVDQWLQLRLNNRKLISITLREGYHNKDRNSNVNEWIKFTDSLNHDEFFFDYLKKEIKEKRKMGHITTLV